MTTKRNPNAKDIYQLGQWLANAEGATYGASWGVTRVCLEALSNFKNVKGLESIGIESEIKRKELSDTYQDDSTSVSEVNMEVLKLKVATWYGRVDEVSKRWILTLPRTHMDIGKLISGAKSFLEEEEWNMLQPLEQQGLNEATACLLSNTFTSAEFIALRTVESILRRWYEKKTGKTIKNVKWGCVLDKLDEEFPEPNRPEEISSLYHLKRRRNAIAHPDVISSEEDATVTFINVINVCKAVKSFLLP